jgi:hypothetical protein
MGDHFSSKTHKEKISCDNFKSAKLEVNKYNSNMLNLCKICNKIHIGTDSRNVITFKLRNLAFEKLNKTISNFILIKKLQI